MKINFFAFFLFVSGGLISCSNLSAVHSVDNLKKAEKTLHSIFSLYASDNDFLLRETYPFNENHKVTYLADNEQSNSQNAYSFLWPYSGGFSASIAIYENSKNTKDLQFIENIIIEGLDFYMDEKRKPASYASYLEKQPLPDRFYDDNVWIGIDFTDLYLLTKDKKHLDKATMIWKFIESGTDSLLGGGIYWCEQKKHSKNTCSNAPGAVYALKLFEATKDSAYFYAGKKLYDWTKTNLQDKNDYLYYDNINLEGRIDKNKFAYNSGQMLQASSLLYKFTKNETYLKEAQKIAKSCHNHFFHDFTTNKGRKIHLMKNGDIWFMAVMMRGFVELYSIDQNREYIDSFLESLDYAWENMREKNGLFNDDWTLKTKRESKWLLTQFAMTEMYARLGNLNL